MERTGTNSNLPWKLSAVSASAYRHYFRCHAGEFHGLFGYLDYMHYRFDFLTHIIVLVAYVEACALREFMIDLSCEMLEFIFAAFETVAVMIADYVGEYSLFDSALY